MPHPTRKAIAKWSVTVVLLLVLYVASSGPMVAFYVGSMTRGSVGEDPVEDERQMARYELLTKVYAPVLWVTDRSDAARSVFHWWIDLWFGLADRYRYQ